MSYLRCSHSCDHDIACLPDVCYLHTLSCHTFDVKCVPDVSMFAVMSRTCRYCVLARLFRGFAKLKKSKNPKKTWIDLTPPTYAHPNFLFWKPSLTWTEHSNHNNFQQCIYIHNTYGIPLQKYLYWFRVILG